MLEPHGTSLLELDHCTHQRVGIRIEILGDPGSQHEVMPGGSEAVWPEVEDALA
ncbi:hypothetical protein GCM10009524_52010 [Spirilliplanes yamanashiensis]